MPFVKQDTQVDIEISAKLTQLTADIVSAYVSNNTVRAEDLGSVIAGVHSALQQGSNGKAETAPEPQAPAVPIKKSVTPDYIISLENGQKFKSIKRHLMNSYGMTPDEYRTKWGLPRDYPMVAPNYAKTRSDLARSLGLGRKASTQEHPAASVSEEQSAVPGNENATAEAPKRRRRGQAAA
jgi:predicted transcriptional regulator